MRVILNANGYIDSYALIGTFGEPSIEAVEPKDITDFENNYGSYYLSEDGLLVKDENRQKEVETQLELDALRAQREKVCFSVINRGELWYSRLSNEEREELACWYDAWLNVTETKVIPETPKWLV